MQNYQLALKYDMKNVKRLTDLNDGMGEPCTGQLKLCDNDSLTWTSGGIKLDNFGSDPPMGSGTLQS